MSPIDVVVRLESPVATSYRCTRAADALDINVAEKSVHELRIAGVDIETPYFLGVLVGASGSGKTTLAQQLFGAECFRSHLDLTKPVIEQFPEAWSYEECASALGGMGLTSVPCWIRPAVTLSNGQRARAEAALALAYATTRNGVVVLDEWTSVVDRTVAKVMSHCLAKYVRRMQRRVVICTCHYDVLEWLDPDWLIDCNAATYNDRRSLPAVARARREQLTFEIRPVHRRTWGVFAKYHYLSHNLPGGHIETFGLFHNGVQIGFQCFANYVPHRLAKTHGNQMRVREVKKMHSNRTVIHPDYAGLGLGILLIDETSALMTAQGYSIYALFSSTPVYRAMSRNAHWQFEGERRRLGTASPFSKGQLMQRDVSSFRTNVTMYAFRYIGPAVGPTPSSP